MNVHTRLGAGSCFEAWLPCAATPEPVGASAAPELPLGHGETVLVLDDDRERLLKTEEILAALGYEPVGFSHPDDAKAACRAAQHRFDAAVLALRATTRLIDVAMALRQAAPELPIALAMAMADHVDTDALADAGVAEVVRNPVAAIEIASALARCLAAEKLRVHQMID
jgi:DNA-binding NtrC family response regulator